MCRIIHPSKDADGLHRRNDGGEVEGRGQSNFVVNIAHCSAYMRVHHRNTEIPLHQTAMSSRIEGRENLGEGRAYGHVTFSESENFGGKSK
jgi:hypothetical protein